MCKFVNCLYAITYEMDEGVEVVIFCTHHDCGPEDCPSHCRPEWVDGLTGFEKAADRSLPIPELVYCRHGLIKCTCGVCTKHKFSVSVIGGHVPNTSSSVYAFGTIGVDYRENEGKSHYCNR